MAESKTKVATPAPAIVEPKYRLPEQLDHCATIMQGSNFSEICTASADFIRELITERTALRLRNVQLESTIKAIAAKAGSI